VSFTMSAQESVPHRELIQRFNDCAGLAFVIDEPSEFEFYKNATIDLAYESSNGKILQATVLEQIKVTSNYFSKNYSVEFINANYATQCGYGETRGFATYYANQRKNMQ